MVNPSQAAMFLEVSAACGLSDSRTLMLGVKATETPQWHDRPNKYGEAWYPVGENITAVYDPSLSAAALPCLQVFLGEQTGTLAGATAFMDKLARRTTRWGATAVQFDRYPWMQAGSERLLEYVRRLGTMGNKIILQAFGEYMTAHEPAALAARLQRLQANGLVDCVLFDASHGTGTTLDTEALHPFIDAAYQQLMPGTGVAIAGGLDAETVRNHLPPLIDTYPDLSWDAESKLHYRDGRHGGILKHEAVAEYLVASAEVLKTEAY